MFRKLPNTSAILASCGPCQESFPYQIPTIPIRKYQKLKSSVLLVLKGLISDASFGAELNAS